MNLPWVIQREVVTITDIKDEAGNVLDALPDGIELIGSDFLFESMDNHLSDSYDVQCIAEDQDGNVYTFIKHYSDAASELVTGVTTVSKTCEIPSETNVVINGNINVSNIDEEEIQGLVVAGNFGADTDVDVKGDVNVVSGGSATGVKASILDGDSELELNVNGSIAAVSNSREFTIIDDADLVIHDATVTKGLEIRNAGGTIDVNVDGSITAEGGGEAYGAFISMNIPDDVVRSKESATALDLNEIEGWWYSDGIKDEDGIYRTVWETAVEENDVINYVLYDKFTGEVLELAPVKVAGNTSLEISGDIKSDDVGMYINLYDEQTADIIVDGTISGDTSGIVLENGTVIDDNLKLTVWEIIPDEDGGVIHRDGADEKENQTYLADREEEKKVQYIVRIADDSSDYISTSGTKEYEGYDVALEGEKVVLLINIPSDCTIDGVYGDKDQEVALMEDENGNYYVIIPRGGGVVLSVITTHIASGQEEKDLDLTDGKKVDSASPAFTQETSEKDAIPVITARIISGAFVVDGLSEIDLGRRGLADAIIPAATHIMANPEVLSVEIPGLEEMVYADDVVTLADLSLDEQVVVLLASLGYLDQAEEYIMKTGTALSSAAASITKEQAEKFSKMTLEEQRRIENSWFTSIKIGGKELRILVISLKLKTTHGIIIQEFGFAQVNGDWMLVMLREGNRTVCINEKMLK